MLRQFKASPIQQRAPFVSIRSFRFLGRRIPSWLGNSTLPTCSSITPRSQPIRMAYRHLYLTGVTQTGFQASHTPRGQDPHPVGMAWRSSSLGLGPITQWVLYPGGGIMLVQLPIHRGQRHGCIARLVFRMISGAPTWPRSPEPGAIRRLKFERVLGGALAAALAICLAGCASPTGSSRELGQDATSKPIQISPVPLKPSPETFLEPPSGSGIWGFLFVAPQCSQGAHPCGRPALRVPGQVVATDSTGNTFGPVASTEELPFVVKLPPGTYQISGRMTVADGVCESIEAEVRPGDYTTVAISCLE